MAGRRPRNTGLKTIQEVERGAKALELRKAGATYEEIAKQLGYADPSGPQKVVMRMLQAIRREPAEELVTLELSRIDRLFLTAYDQALKGSLPAIDRCIRLMERRAALLGLDDALPAFNPAEELDLEAVAAQAAAEFGWDASKAITEVEQIINEARRKT